MPYEKLIGSISSLLEKFHYDGLASLYFKSFTLRHFNNLPHFALLFFFPLPSIFPLPHAFLYAI